MLLSMVRRARWSALPPRRTPISASTTTTSSAAVLERSDREGILQRQRLHSASYCASRCCSSSSSLALSATILPLPLMSSSAKGLWWCQRRNFHHTTTRFRKGTTAYKGQSKKKEKKTTTKIEPTKKKKKKKTNAVKQADVSAAPQFPAKEKRRMSQLTPRILRLMSLLSKDETRKEAKVREKEAKRKVRLPRATDVLWVMAADACSTGHAAMWIDGAPPAKQVDVLTHKYPPGTEPDKSDNSRRELMAVLDLLERDVDSIPVHANVLIIEDSHMAGTWLLNKYVPRGRMKKDTHTQLQKRMLHIFSKLRQQKAKLFVKYVPSEMQVADDPSRGMHVKPHLLEHCRGVAREWWAEHVAGRTPEFQVVVPEELKAARAEVRARVAQAVEAREKKAQRSTKLSRLALSVARRRTAALLLRGRLLTRGRCEITATKNVAPPVTSPVAIPSSSAPSLAVPEMKKAKVKAKTKTKTKEVKLRQPASKPSPSPALPADGEPKEQGADDATSLGSYESLSAEEEQCLADLRRLLTMTRVLMSSEKQRRSDPSPEPQRRKRKERKAANVDVPVEVTAVELGSGGNKLRRFEKRDELPFVTDEVVIAKDKDVDMLRKRSWGTTSDVARRLEELKANSKSPLSPSRQTQLRRVRRMQVALKIAQENGSDQVWKENAPCPNKAASSSSPGN